MESLIQTNHYFEDSHKGIIEGRLGTAGCKLFALGTLAGKSRSTLGASGSRTSEGSWVCVFEDTLFGFGLKVHQLAKRSP